MGSIEKVEKLTWTIENFSEWDHSEEMYSETFFLSGLPWQIRISEEEGEEYLSIYLFAGDLANLPEGWSRFTNFKLSLIDQANGERTIVQETEHEFHAIEPGCGFTDFIELDELWDSSDEFLVNDTCKIEVEIISIRNLVDFRGLGKIEKSFVPLLEDVCSRHLSLVDCQRKRNSSLVFTKWAFTALGRVLHFLKTKKLKDMDDDACDRLQVLWGELKTCGFDLSWLQPRIQFAMDMRGYVERVAQVQKLKENVDALQLDLKIAISNLDKAHEGQQKLKENVDALQLDLKTAINNLVKAHEGFIERDLDAELGYPGA